MIVAFFSPKGGAGRTTALANCALEMARSGNRVLAVDFDLDAPSLHCFFGLDDKATLTDKHSGVVDLTQAFLDAASGMTESFPGLETEHLLAPEWKPVTTVRGKRISGIKKKVLDVHPDADLRILGAGRLDDGYRDRAAAIHWGELYDQPAFREYVVWLRGRFEALADVTFIDARAGATDIGSVCAFALADFVVMCCPPTFQALNTTFAFVRRAAETRADGAKGRCLLVASRVQRGADDRHLAYWREAAIKGAEALSELWVVGRGRDTTDAVAAARAMVERFEVPEVPVHSVGEPLIRVRMLEREEGTDPLLEAWGPLLGEIRGRMPWREPNHAASVKAAEEALARGITEGKLDPLPDLYSRLGDALWEEGEAHGWTPERAARLEEVANRGIALAEVKADKAYLGYLLLLLGRAHILAERPKLAVEQIERAVKLLRELEHHSAVGVALDSLGRALSASGDRLRAVALFEEAIRVKREASPQNHFSIGVSLYNLALEHRNGGDRGKARVLLAEGIAEERKAPDPEHESIGISLVALAEEQLAAGELSGARASFMEAIQEFGMTRRGARHISSVTSSLAALNGSVE